jgi:protein-S-isoprenylcysteine O-methyltransferase Ste14
MVPVECLSEAMQAIHAHLIPDLWLAWAIYWWISARSIKAVRRREGAASRAAHVAPLVVAALLLAPSTLPGGFLCQRLLPASLATFWIGATSVALGLGFSAWARARLGGNWSGTVTIKHGHELIRSGPYAYVRHPIYTGLLAALVGSAIARGEWRGLVAVVIAFAALWRKLKLEERWLIETFGESYACYRAEVAALIPFLL